MFGSTSPSRLALVLSFALRLIVPLARAAPDASLVGDQNADGLFRRQSGSYAITGAPGADGAALPIRQEIRALQQNGDLWNLYLLGLERMQARDQNDMLSWYQIAGIHGRPYRPWDNVQAAPGQQNSGYCTHTSVLFPTWHRPYLALYEQVLYNIIQEIAGEFNGTDRARYTQAARNFRAPYWDWAAAPPNNGPVLPTSLSEARVEVNSPTGRRTINNPLYQYTFHPLSTTDFPDSPLSAWPSTLRYPSDSSPNAQSRNNLVEEQLRNNRLSYRDRIYNLFTAYNNYTEFSSKAWFPSDGGNYDSIESVHDQIHGLTGNGGHMGYVDYSSFDPIFFLHHIMVDRVFALWQALHPNSYVEPRRTDFGTFTTTPGSTEDVNTNLTPFHADSSGRFWTSAAVRSVRTFGYTYAELADTSQSPEQLQASVRTAVNRLYGQTAPANIVTRRWFRRRRGPRPRSLGIKHLVARENKTDPTPLDTPAGLVRDDGKYYEYIANIRVKKFALKGSFFVHLFLGDFDPNPAKWTFEPNLIGSHCVFSNTPESCSHCKSQAAKDLEVTGTIPLTTALLNAIKRGHLPSLDPKDVDPFLQRNLHWRVSMLDDKCVQNTQVPGLKVAVLSSEVKKPERPDEFPQWGSLSPREDVTRNKTTGYSHSDRL